MKKALITGINGFVGGYLLTELQSQGYTVIGAGSEEQGRGDLYFQMDVTQKERIREILLEQQPTYIFHLAGISAPGFAEKNPELTFAVNVEGTKNLLEAASVFSEKPRALIVSSSHIYGDPMYLPIDEKHPLNPHTVYGKSRIEQEKGVEQYQNNFSLIIVARSFNHTGPGQDTAMIVPKIISQMWEIKRGQREHIELGDNELKRDITHVKDVVRAYRMLLEQSEWQGVCNVCRGESISLKDIAEYAKVKAGLDVSVEAILKVNTAFLRPDDPKDIYGDNSLLKQVIDWQIEYSYPSLFDDISDSFSTSV